jgi:hypothetical protein
LHGDGTLSIAPPDDEPPDVYLYNPMRPVPTIGGQVILPGGNATGQRDLSRDNPYSGFGCKTGKKQRSQHMWLVATMTSVTALIHHFDNPTL